MIFRIEKFFDRSWSCEKMGKAANGKAMRARRKKRYERINPIIEHREELINARFQVDLAEQSGLPAPFEPPPKDQWQKDISVGPNNVQVHDRDSIDADVEELRQKLHLPPKIIYQT